MQYVSTASMEAWQPQYQRPPLVRRTSTASLIAFMLGRLRMTIDECINMLSDGRPARILLIPVLVGNVLGAKGVNLPANKPQTLVRGPDVRVQIRRARQRFVTPLLGTLDRLPLLRHASGVVHVDVPLQFSLAPALDLAEHAVDVLLVHVRLRH